mgnify:CR=1 FL=1
MAPERGTAGDDPVAREGLVRQIQASLLEAQAARAQLEDAAKDTPEDRARAVALAREFADEVAKIEALVKARPA